MRLNIDWRLRILNLVQVIWLDDPDFRCVGNILIISPLFVYRAKIDATHEPSLTWLLYLFIQIKFLCLCQQLLLFATALVLYIGMLGIRGPLPAFVVLVHFNMLNIVVPNSVSANRIWRLLCLSLRILDNSCSEILLFSLTTFGLVTEGDMSSRPILIRSSRAV